ncbi:hypothetical protein BD414DRAFT_511137 [Trametes punicea]|nr:hypothetical protein BD414DRAFT_511137 [Trametes punicea]
MASIHLSDSTTITSDTCSMRQETQTDSTYFSKFPGLFADELQYALRLEMDGKVVLVDYDKFMGHFVPLPDKTVSLPRDELRGLRLEDVAVGSESTMYPVLADKLNQPWLCPGYHFVTTSDAASLEDPSNRRLIGGLYPVAETPEAGSCSDWASIEISIECQADEVSGDPFEDTMDSGLPNTDDRREILQRMTTVSSVVFVKQQRTHHFTVIVCGSSARISRWDHAGVVTTKKFNYKEEPEKLAEFFWRFARLSPAQRGHDTSVVRVLEGTEDYKLMQERAEEPRLLLEIHPVQEHAREAFRESLKGSRWWKIQVDDESSRESDPSAPTTPRFFLVGKPHFAARGLAGRGTRGYVAIDLQNPKRPFVYLKDAWRVAHTGIHKEGETLTYLNKEGVRNIPTKECHGDVGLSQTTMSQTIWREENPDALTCPLKTHTHYRLVVREVGLPMSEFQNAQELIFLVARCISAHGDAYRKGIMHRDISAGNVLILVTESVDAQGNLCTHRDGMLTDWELSKSVQDGQIDVLRQPDRTVCIIVTKLWGNETDQSS